MRDYYGRILIFNTAFPGDIVLTTPLVRAAYERFPGTYLAFCTTPAGASLLAGLSYLDRIIVYDKRGADRGVRGFLRTASRLRAERFDLVLSTHRSARSAMLLRLAGIGRRVGFARSAMGRLYSTRVERRPELHEARRNLALLEPFGVSGKNISPRPVLPVGGEEAGHVLGLLGVNMPGRKGPLVVVAPGSVWGTKMWFADRFARVVDLLTDMYGARVVLAGSPVDRAQADRVLELAKSPVLDLVGMTSLRDLCALVSKADLLVCGDSAPMHVAWAYDIPTVAIFGATTPELGFAPESERCRVVEVRELDCRPCSDHGPSECPLGHFRCMKGVSVDMVLSSCRQMLELGGFGASRARSG